MAARALTPFGVPSRQARDGFSKWPSRTAETQDSKRPTGSLRASAPAGLADLYHYAWFVGFAVAFAAYLLLRNLTTV
jgi:hypothetical protein